LLLRCKSNTLVHHGATKRSDPIDQAKPKTAGALHREKVAQQRSVNEADRGTSPFNVGTAQPIIFGEHPVVSDVCSACPRLRGKRTDRGSIANAQIEALCADRRHDMTGLADENNAACGK
jgi:hypothetical protein